MKPTLLLLLPLAATLYVSPSLGFCRATTCDPADASQGCQVDPSTGCVTSGSPLRWPGGCLTVNVQKDGAPAAGISADAAEASVRRALEAWLTADCGDGSPAITVEVGSRVSCNAAEYFTEHHNANIIMFRDEQWPYPGGEDALGITRLHFDGERAPGELWDADIELNAVTEPLAVGALRSNQVDLDSLITHELGHLFGLGHSLERGATMLAGYVRGSTELRSLSPDDVAGICAIYPPGRALGSSSCEPRHGFSELCASEQAPFVEPAPPSEQASSNGSSGCHFGAAGSPAPLVALLVWGWLGLRRRALRAR